MKEPMTRTEAAQAHTRHVDSYWRLERSASFEGALDAACNVYKLPTGERPPE